MSKNPAKNYDTERGNLDHIFEESEVIKIPDERKRCVEKIKEITKNLKSEEEEQYLYSELKNVENRWKEGDKNAFSSFLSELETHKSLYSKIQKISSRIESAKNLKQAQKKLFRSKSNEIKSDQASTLKKKEQWFMELEKSLDEYEQFEKEIKNKIFKERKNIIDHKIADISLWGGQIASFYGKKYPGEAASERSLWTKEITGAFRRGKISSEEARKRANLRLILLKKEQKKRKKVVENFLKIRDLLNRVDINMPDVNKMIDDKSFNGLTQDERIKMLWKIDGKISKHRIIDLLSGKRKNAKSFLELFELQEWQKKQALEFHKTMLKIQKTGNKKSDRNAWDFFDDEEKKLMGIKKGNESDIFDYWINIFQDEKHIFEEKILDKVFVIKENARSLTDLSELGSNLKELKKQKKTNLKKIIGFLEYFSQIPSRLKRKEQIINTELMLLEINDQLIKSNKLEEKDEEQERINDIEKAKSELWKLQRKNEFIRRMFLQIAALSMSYGTNVVTMDKSEKKYVGRIDKISFDEFEKRKQRSLLEATKAETENLKTNTNNIQTGNVGGFDVTSAEEKHETEVKKEDGEVKARISDDGKKKHISNNWEMTRVAGWTPWTVEDNEKYLREVVDQKKHLTLTDGYMPVGQRKAESVLENRALQNLASLPGNNAKEKKLYLQAMFLFIRQSRAASNSFVRSILEY